MIDVSFIILTYNEEIHLRALPEQYSRIELIRYFWSIAIRPTRPAKSPLHGGSSRIKTLAGETF